MVMTTLWVVCMWMVFGPNDCDGGDDDGDDDDGGDGDDDGDD